MSGKPKEYRINALMDFANVPDDRMGDCLVDFVAWLNFAKAMPPELENMGFVWIDDGRPGVEFCEVNLVNKKTGETMETHVVDLTKLQGKPHA